MKSFIYSALKLSKAKPDVHCVSKSITNDEQFKYINTGEVYFRNLPREVQINYLLLVAAEQDEFENSFLYAALKLFNCEYSRSIYSKSALGEDITSARHCKLLVYQNLAEEKCSDQSKQFNIDFALLIAAEQGEI